MTAVGRPLSRTAGSPLPNHGITGGLRPACRGELRIIAFLTPSEPVTTILEHLGLPYRPPPLSPARAAPLLDLDLDQTPAFSPADPEPIPEFGFDQRVER